MSSRRKAFAAAGILLLLLLVARIAWDYFDRHSVAHESMQIQLKRFGAAVYEYHSATGRWPARLDDLAQTSLARQSPIWKAAAGTLVFLWPKEMPSDAKENAARLLIYDRGGVFNRMGRVWVCWGDLRTEFVPAEQLREQLAKQDGH